MGKVRPDYSMGQRIIRVSDADPVATLVCRSTKTDSTTSSSIIIHLKSIFARFGIPAKMVSDNGPQFSSQEMKKFLENNGFRFRHIKTSPHYPQADGLAERSVNTVKSLLKHSTGPHKALLSYQATPMPWCALSLAELLMGRKRQTDVLQVKENSVPIEA